MLGNFQQSHIRIELEATHNTIRDSLLNTNQLLQWQWPVRFSPGLPEQMYPGLTFTSSIGPLSVQHEVKTAESHCLRLLLSQGIDGYHEWCWGDGWVQSRLEGISLMPLNLSQTLNLLKLRQFVEGGKGLAQG